jgi:hypothetical protein
MRQARAFLLGDLTNSTTGNDLLSSTWAFRGSPGDCALHDCDELGLPPFFQNVLKLLKSAQPSVAT